MPAGLEQGKSTMKHLIIGNGPTGVIAAETIARNAPQDQVTLLGDEPEPCYSRMAIPYLLKCCGSLRSQAPRSSMLPISR